MRGSFTLSKLQVMHGHGAAVVLAVGKDLDALDKAGGVGRGWGPVRVPDAEGDLDGLGVDEGCPLVSGMRQTLEVVGEKELSELGKYCASRRAVT